MCTMYLVLNYVINKFELNHCTYALNVADPYPHVSGNLDFTVL